MRVQSSKGKEQKLGVAWRGARNRKPRAAWELPGGAQQQTGRGRRKGHGGGEGDWSSLSEERLMAVFQLPRQQA